MNIIENNELLATFVNWVFYDDEGQYYDTVEGLFVTEQGEDLEFHKSWDHLMVVVEKIESLGYYFGMSTDGVGVWGRDPVTIIYANDIEDDPKINRVYDTIINFIKWYNENI